MALLSMTGYGSGRAELAGVRIEVEMRSVNHRFLDLSWRLPQTYSRFEADLSRVLRAQFRRGHFDISVSRRATAEAAYEISLNQSLFSAYVQAYQSTFKAAGASEKLPADAVLQILRAGDVLDVRSSETDISVEYKAVEAALNEAASMLGQARSAEGQVLAGELLFRLQNIEAQIGKIKPQVAVVVQGYREKLRAKIQQLVPDSITFDERIAQEVAFFADRADISEELVRLETHCTHFMRSVQKNEGGKKLEFLLQEMGREVNTIGSKSQSGEITAAVIEAKAELEKLREQVQNVE